MGPRNADSFFCIPISEYEVKAEINELNISKGPGLDLISSRLVVDAEEIFTPILTAIYNKSIAQDTVPDGFKKTLIIPIHKAASPDEVENYRPIAILPIFAKILERLILKRIISFLDKHKIIHKKQYGFRKGHSTIDALADIISKLQEALNNNLKNILLCVDLSKAFDTINHAILLRKLDHYGLRGKINRWFASYLSNRVQRVRWQDHYSEEASIVYGVPQGSILGPVLFVLYVNDLPNIVEYGDVSLFADDSGVIYSGEDFDCIGHHAQQDLQAISEWSINNRLTINTNKTHYVKITSAHSKTDVSLNLHIVGTPIHEENSTKFLGVYIDCHLRWDLHIQKVLKQIATYVGTLSYVRHFLPFHALKVIYDSFVNSRISYGIEIWGGCYRSLLKPLQVMQNKAIRFISFMDFRESVRPMFKRLKIRDLSSLHKLKTSILAHKCVKNDPDRFTFFKSPRNSNNIILPAIKNNYGQNSITTNIIKLYNILPESIKSSPHCNKVKTQIKQLEFS